MTKRGPGKKALIVHTGGGLGDVLLAGPVIDSLKAADYEVDFLARKATSQAILHHPSVNEVLTIESKDPVNFSEMRIWVTTLKARNYDVVFLLWSTTRWAWTLFMSGIPRRVGQASRLMYSYLFTHKVRIRSESGDVNSHWTEILLDYPRAAGISTVTPKPIFPIDQESHKTAEALLASVDFGDQDGPLIGFHSGKGLPLGPERWPVEHFSMLASQLQKEFNARLILTGGPNEVELVRVIGEGLDRPHANVAGQTSLQVLAALAQKCQVFVCPDSGPMHLAAAVGTPVVGIFALDEDFPHRWAPFGVPHRIIRPPRPACRPNCKKPSCPDFKCYLTVRSQELSLAVAQLLGQASSPTPSPEESPQREGNRQAL